MARRAGQPDPCCVRRWTGDRSLMSEPSDLAWLLLGLARDDEFAARSLLPVAGVADAILGFHSQQAVEKALKAALACRDMEFPYTHDLDGLIELCRTQGLVTVEARGHKVGLLSGNARVEAHSFY